MYFYFISNYVPSFVALATPLNSIGSIQAFALNLHLDIKYLLLFISSRSLLSREVFLFTVIFSNLVRGKKVKISWLNYREL